MLPLIVKVEVVLWSLLDELEIELELELELDVPIASSVVVLEVFDSVEEAEELSGGDD